MKDVKETPTLKLTQELNALRAIVKIASNKDYVKQRIQDIKNELLKRHG